MLDENLLLCKKEPAIMFVFKYNKDWSLGRNPNTVTINYTYTDPSTKQTVTKSVNSTNDEYVFPCAIGDTVTFSNLIIGNPAHSGWGTLFRNGVDVSPTELRDYYDVSFSVTVSGSSPYIEYYFMYGPT